MILMMHMQDQKDFLVKLSCMLNDFQFLDL